MRNTIKIYVCLHLVYGGIHSPKGYNVCDTGRIMATLGKDLVFTKKNNLPILFHKVTYTYCRLLALIRFYTPSYLWKIIPSYM